MRHFVSHDTGEFSFVVGGSDGSYVDEHRSARECECIYLFLRNNVKIKRPRVLRWNGSSQLMPQLPNVLRFKAAVGKNWHLLINLSSSVETERALLLTGHVHVPRVRELGTGKL